MSTPDRDDMEHLTRMKARPSAHEIAVAIEKKRREHDETTDPQRRAVLEGVLGDLMRALRRAARRQADQANQGWSWQVGRGSGRT